MISTCTWVERNAGHMITMSELGLALHELTQTYGLVCDHKEQPYPCQVAAEFVRRRVSVLSDAEAVA